MSLIALKKDLRKEADSKKKKLLQGFFKTGKGEYGEGDIFLGVTVPKSRKVAKKHADLPFPDIEKLLKSKIHEERLVALLLLVYVFERGDLKKRSEVFNFYLTNTKYINNWDLVDLTAHKIVGAHLEDKPHDIL